MSVPIVSHLTRPDNWLKENRGWGGGSTRFYDILSEYFITETLREKQLERVREIQRQRERERTNGIVVPQSNPGAQ